MGTHPATCKRDRGTDVATVRPVIIRSGSGAAGVLLLLLAIAGLLALFSGNLDRLINAIAGSAGGAEGLIGAGGDPAVQDRVPVGGSTPLGQYDPANAGGARNTGAPVEVARRGGFQR